MEKKIGTALVVNGGELYTISPNMAKELGATNYVDGANFEEKYGNGVKVNIINHDDDNYLIEKDGQEYLICKYGLEDIKLLGKQTPEKPKKFIVSWEVKGCGDPQERFATFTEADKKARELVKDDTVITKSIDIVEFVNRWQVTPIVTIKKVKEK